MTPKPEKPVMVTTPIYYVNGNPHVGHLYTSLLADSISRWCHLRNIPSYFLTGVDEHGQKVGQTAEANGITPKEWCDQMNDQFMDLYRQFDIQADRHIRTTDDDHVKAVQHVWRKLVEKGLIYKGKYEGWYCTSDEAFVTELNTHDVTNPVTGQTEKRTIDSDKPVHWLVEENYRFRLSAFEKPLLEMYNKHPEMIEPEFRRDEIVQFIKSGLNDLSVSRKAVKWGIPVPDDPDHTIYVWIDALTNYISAAGYPDLFEDGADGQTNKSHWGDYTALPRSEPFTISQVQPNALHGGVWPARMHIIGKDIMKFHCVYWPAFLIGLGVAVPDQLFVHGWWTKNKMKISKSSGNSFEIGDTLQLIGGKYNTDAFRYVLMKSRY